MSNENVPEMKNGAALGNVDVTHGNTSVKVGQVSTTGAAIAGIATVVLGGAFFILKLAVGGK